VPFLRSRFWMVAMDTSPSGRKPEVLPGDFWAQFGHTLYQHSTIRANCFQRRRPHKTLKNITIFVGNYWLKLPI